MEYKGKEIGIPTLEMFREYILREKFDFPAEFAYKHFEKKGWRDKQGNPLNSVERSLNGFNGSFNRMRLQNSMFCGSLF